jgi:hypothetical protein
MIGRDRRSTTRPVRLLDRRHRELYQAGSNASDEQKLSFLLPLRRLFSRWPRVSGTPALQVNQRHSAHYLESP